MPVQLLTTIFQKEDSRCRRQFFAKTYRSYGLATGSYPVFEIEARVEAFENGRGFTLGALAARKPRTLSKKQNV